MLRPAMSLLLLVAGVTYVRADDETAARKSKPASSSKSAKTKSKTKVSGKRWNTKVNSKTRMDNMPRGWAWPPTHDMLSLERSCETKLDAASIPWTPAAREGHIPDAVTIADMKLGGVVYTGIYTKGPSKMDCQLALALENVGTDLYALGVREVKFGSIYRWSQVRVGGKTHNILSRHALGLAMDVVSFVDEHGREAVVGKDYKKGDELLHAIEKAINESGKFRLVLTPQNDPISHKDHFHLEANPDYSAPPSS